MDEEILKAFGEIRGKLEEFNITEDWLIEHAHGLRDNRLEEDDCLFVIERLMPFISWYMEVMPLDRFDNLTEWREIPFDVFLKFEREEAKIPEEIISDEEMYEIYNDALPPALHIPDMNMTLFQGQDSTEIKRRAYVVVKGLILISMDLAATICIAPVNPAAGIVMGYLLAITSIKYGEKCVRKGFLS